MRITEIIAEAANRKKQAAIAIAKKKKKGVAEGLLNEFAIPGGGDGDSGRWYNDDELADIIGDDWFEDFDVSNDGFNIDAYGEKAKKNLVGYANTWFDDKGYNVNVMGVEHNDVDHDLQWYIVGSFHNPRFANEGMAGKVVFSGTGDNGGKYEIIQSGDGFMIHANGRHIDTYGSLQRAMSVLKNEVPGLQQGVAEGQADQVKKIVKKNGKPVGEIGTDPEASPGNGNWYVKHYASGYDVVGFDNAEEALAELKHCMKQGVAEGRFQDEYPEYGGKDKNKAMTYDRNVGMGYEGEPWSDSNSNWSGDNPNYADSTYEPEPVILQGPDGKQKAFSPDSPEVQGVYDREYGIQNKLGQITKAFQKGIDFNANRPTPYTNLATSDSTNDFTDPIKLGQYDVDFPEQTVINPKNGEVTTIPSPNNPIAPYQKPAPATSKSQVDLTKFGINPDSSKLKSNLVVTDKPAVNKPAVNKPASSSSIPAKPRPGSWQELAKLNNITDPRKLKANTYIKTPDGESVYVNKGDTLSRLAQRMRPIGVKENITHQLAQEFEMFLESSIEEDWNKVNKKDKTSGMSQKAVNAYRRENPGSKLKTAVTTKPSKLKPGSKAAKRRKSFCARMGGNKGPMKKPNGKPTPKALALRRWNCESIEELQELLMLAEQFVNKKKNESI